MIFAGSLSLQSDIKRGGMLSNRLNSHEDHMNYFTIYICCQLAFSLTGLKVHAPINVKPAVGGGGGGSQGMGWGFDIFEKFAVIFPAHGQIIPVKCNQISPPRAAHRCQISQGWQRKIQIFPLPGERGQSNALPQGQQRQSNPHPMP